MFCVLRGEDIKMKKIDKKNKLNEEINNPAEVL